MKSARAFLLPTAVPRWLLGLLAPVVVVGIVAMHSLLVQAPSEGHHAASMLSATATQSTHGTDAPGQVGHMDDGPLDPSSDMTDCGSLMAICLALLVSFAGLALLPRGTCGRVLWQRPLAQYVQLGDVRRAFEALTPRQRTTVIRC